MDLQVNAKSHVPVHVQLEEQIKHLILSGEFGVGERLPSIRALAGYLRVNRNTVNRVFSNLAREEGIVVEYLAYALLARAGIPSLGKKARIPVLFVECTPSELARYAVEL